MPVDAHHLRHLRGEDQDRERVDEARPDRPRDEAHQHVEAQQPEGDLEQPGQQRRAEQIGQPMRMDERGGDQRDRTGRARDHRRASASDRDHDADHEGSEQSNLRIDAGDEGEGDDLRDQREGADHARQHLATSPGGAAEPFGAITR
jgi:hypothetical protein